MKNAPFHVKMLLDEVQRRKETNPRYSLRAFSKFLGIGPSTLSRILSNHQELSLTACRNIIKKLHFNHDDCLLFIASVAEEKKLRALRLLSSTIDDDSSSFEWMTTNTPDLMFVLDRKGRCIHANSPVAEFFKLEPNQVIGKTLAEIGIPEDIASKIKGYVFDIFQTAKHVKVDECYKVKKETACFEITLVPILKQKQEIRAVACYWRDISEKVAMENLLKLHLKCGEILSTSTDPLSTMNQIMKVTVENFSCASIVQLLDQDVLLKQGDDGIAGEFLELFPLVYDHNQNYKNILDFGKPEVVNLLDKASFNLFNKMKMEVGSFLCVPLTVSGKIYGSLTFLRSKDKNPFSVLEIQTGKDLGQRLLSTLVCHPKTTL